MYQEGLVMPCARQERWRPGAKRPVDSHTRSRLRPAFFFLHFLIDLNLVSLPQSLRIHITVVNSARKYATTSATWSIFKTAYSIATSRVTDLHRAMMFSRPSDNSMVRRFTTRVRRAS